MATAPVIFDRALARARLARAIRSGGEDFLLAQVTDDLVDRLNPIRRTFTTVLDIGSPRGDAAARLMALLPQAFVVRAAGTPDRATPPFRFVVADEEVNPFGGEHFDLAVSLMSLHGVNDLPGALSQIRRCLKPDGLFLGVMLGGQSLQELRSVLTEAEAEQRGGASPRVAPFSDLRDLGHLLQRAGFALPVADTDRIVVRYGSLFGLAADLRAMGATNTLVERSRRPLARGVVLRAAELYQERFADPDGRIRATFDLVWLLGWCPHESQQKPLKPGSAKMRLADALGVPEGRLAPPP